MLKPLDGAGTGPARDRQRGRTRATAVLTVLALMGAGAALGGCASMKEVRVDVRSFGAWPPGRAPGTYAFDRLPSQQSQAAVQDQLERAAVPALEAAGFKPVDRQLAQVWVQVSMQVIQTREEVWPSMGWSMRQGYGDWRQGWDTGLGLDFRPAYYEQRVGLLVRDRQSGEVLHEAQGVVGGTRVNEANWRPMFEALLKDFPGPAVSPRTVVVPREGAASAP